MTLDRLKSLGELIEGRRINRFCYSHGSSKIATPTEPVGACLLSRACVAGQASLKRPLVKRPVSFRSLEHVGRSG